MGNRDGPLSVCNLPGDYAGFPGCGLLRLHSTYRHDLKIYASDEGRVQMTAAAFAKVIQTIADVLPAVDGTNRTLQCRSVFEPSVEELNPGR